MSSERREPHELNAAAGYSETVIEHAVRPRNVGSLPNAEGFAAVTGSCGDILQIWLRIDGDRIRRATFWTNGCGPTIAAGSMVTEIACGKTVAEALDIEQEDILEALGGLPEENKECAMLWTKALKDAIRDYLALKNEPWKRIYR